MSIQSEITRLSDARAALDAAIAAKGVQVPGSARLGVSSGTGSPEGLSTMA